MLKNADARLAEYLAELAKADDQNAGPAAGRAPVMNLTEKIATLQKRRDEHARIQAELERTGESPVSLTDPDIPKPRPLFTPRQRPCSHYRHLEHKRPPENLPPDRTTRQTPEPGSVSSLLQVG